MDKESLCCCHRCQQFETCVEKWLKGEKHQTSYCCEKCQNYKECFKQDVA